MSEKIRLMAVVAPFVASFRRKVRTEKSSMAVIKAIKNIRQNMQSVIAIASSVA